ncbi:MAG TPA: alpha/beta fold hydrolase [Jatrophihabitantaceae bacterium]|nr:alpha/beta fold hydrolase [Jatrophihabitantaceae bacterium]
MRLPTWAVRTLFVLVVAAVLVGAAAVIIHFRSGNGPRGGISDNTVSITASDGVKLSAEVITPNTAGPFPLLVMPASWNSPALEYRTIGAKFAAAAFVVVAYAQRGFRGSGGSVDLAGRKSQKDVSSVIDWALKHTHADASRVGVFGVSYGGGVGLLAAGQDSRIKAVVATSAWTDLGAALAPHGTANLAGLRWMFSQPGAEAALDPQVRQLDDDAKNHPDAAAALLATMSKTRSAAREIQAINRNKPAIMIANAYDDSLLDPSSLVTFFNKLHTPKRLEFATGDHGGPEIPGLLGRSSRTIDTGAKWIDYYLNGIKNGITSSGPVVLQDQATGAFHSYKSWPTAHTTLHLGTPGSSGSLTPSTATSWSQPLTTGAASGATSGTQQIQKDATYQPVTLSIGSVKSSAAYVWSGVPATRALRVSGTPTLRVHVDSSASAVTLFGYLYDVTASGSATLMTYAPTTLSSGNASITLRPVSWTVPAGHHLVLVVATADENFQSAEPSGGLVTLSSPGALSV